MSSREGMAGTEGGSEEVGPWFGGREEWSAREGEEWFCWL